MILTRFIFNLSKGCATPLHQRFQHARLLGRLQGSSRQQQRVFENALRPRQRQYKAAYSAETAYAVYCESRVQSGTHCTEIYGMRGAVQVCVDGGTV